MGEVGSSDDSILVSVVGRSLPELQFDAKTEVPNGVTGDTKLDRCGIDPARSLANNVFALLGGPCLAGSAGEGGALNGLVDGVGREVLEKSDWPTLTPLTVPTGENLEGTVPALTRRDGLVRFTSDGGTRSGNPSWEGDSGMVSRNGVEFPLVGGPQMLGERPSLPCSSRVRLGNSLEACSCNGEPAPFRELPSVELGGPMVLALPKTDFIEAPAVGSIGDVLVVEDSDRGNDV